MKIVGQANAITEAADQAPYLTEWRDRYVGRTSLVLRPGSTDEVSQILKVANTERIAVVPQGGNTGLVGGQIPFETGKEVVISLSRLNRIRHVDSGGDHMVCEAGVTLAQAQATADETNRLFPLSLASEGTCQIGGNIATNAGGTGVLAYGNTRQLTLGLEIVLADGSVLTNLKPLKKDNTGYDLSNLFIGSEGTLGIITAATLKLFPKPLWHETAFVACPSLEAIAKLYQAASTSLAQQLTAFEFLPTRAIQFLEKHVEKIRAPVETTSPWYVLLEISHLSDPATQSQETPETASAFETLLADAIDQRLADDVAIAASQSQQKDFWQLRELLSEVQKFEGGSIKHDISVPVHAIPEFISRGNALIEKLCPGARPVPFGHFGDGNVHYNISQPANADKSAFLDRWEEVNAAVHALVTEMGGSISAEHGIGRMKREELVEHKDPIALHTMRAIKNALDPVGIMNPGKVL